MSDWQSLDSDTILQNLFGSFADGDSDEDSDVDINPDKSNVEVNVRLSAVVEMSEMGGCRGIRSLCDIPPGVLLLAETPAITWNDNNLELEEDLRANL